MIEKQTGRKIKMLQIDNVESTRINFNNLDRIMGLVFTSQLETWVSYENTPRGR